MPGRPPVPQVVADWVRADNLDQTENDPEILPEITVIVERKVPDPEAPEGVQRTIVEEVSEARSLEDHPEVEEAWIEYFLEKWDPWAQEMRQWQEVQTVYENLDFMRRRLEEAEERYELLLAIGFLQWRDPTGRNVARHVLTAPAELTLDATRGILTVLPAASFERFRVELDMLEPQHRPRLDKTIDEQIEVLDAQAWDIDLLKPVLEQIANKLHADAEVDESLQRADRSEDRPQLTFAPAVVLRERRPMAYDELVSKFHESANNEELEPTEPWLRLLREGEVENGGSPGSSTGPDEFAAPVVADRLLFPLPANEEQRQIVERLQAQPCVLVKGPPGTGKSHTIANLVSHLLAKGERILVTAHAPKALAVLLGLLPEGIRDLSVAALGSSRDDQRRLEDSVRRILSRKNEWKGAEHTQREIEEAEKGLGELNGELARIERDLCTFREAETYSHELGGGYSGTAAQIARALHEQEDEFGWFPELPANVPFPLSSSEKAFLVDGHVRFSAETRSELELDVGAGEFPSPDDFENLVTRLTAAKKSAERMQHGADAAKLDQLNGLTTADIKELRTAVQELESLALQAGRVLGASFQTILGDLLVLADSRWRSLTEKSEVLLNDCSRLMKAIGTVRVGLPQDIDEDRLRADVARRLDHFEQGGRKGFSVLAPRVVRETQYIVDKCLVDGQKIRQIEQLHCLRDHLELEGKIQELRRLWASCISENLSPRDALSRSEELTEELKGLLAFLQTDHASAIAAGLGPKRTDLVTADQRERWLKALDACLASRAARDAQSKLENLIRAIRSAATDTSVHRCMRALEQAVETQDVAAWRTAWNERERVHKGRQDLARYDAILAKVEEACAGVGKLLRSTSGDASWRDRIRNLEEAWAWAAARAWIRHSSDESAYGARVKDYHRTQRRIEKATEELVALRAWKAFFDRLDERTVQNLNAWTSAVSRIGKGTGKYAYRHRRTARQYLMECIPSIPAWIMPLYKLWESVDAVPGLFDTVIVDEASQASVDALALLLLAKRIVVVGDDKQNSPEAVGVLENDIARLAREHLPQFRFRDEYRTDTSLFDHAERSFGNLISLREHFRCVPEIIRFSNDLCYQDAPLIPLRQAPPDRLPPLQSRFIAKGACEAKGQRILNRAEAEALVDTIERLVDEEAYEGKSMGVIALQGHAQAESIEALLAKRLGPKVIEERRLRCGAPASFQGDQRDVIFLSLVIAPNVRYRALTGLPDQRRFNVAMSRARDQVCLFYSVRQHDLAPHDLRRRLIRFFENPQRDMVNARFEDLERLEREARGPRQQGTQPEPYESWFEVDVALELLRRKFQVSSQVEVAGRRIDLVVEGLDARLAVECAGDHWHGAEQYEQDMARQRQLERAGWTFITVRESDFYANHKRAIEAVLEACEEMGIRPADFLEDLDQSVPVSIDTVDPERTRSSNDGSANATGKAEENASDDYYTSLEADRTESDSEETGFPDPREASMANVREALQQIIEREGPLTRTALYRRYVARCPTLQRAGRAVRQVLNRAIGTMLRAKEILQEDELGDGSSDSQVLRLFGTPPVRIRPAGNRNLLEIPPSELQVVVRRIFHGSSLPQDKEKVFRAILNHYDIPRLTRPRREYLSRVLKQMENPGG